MSEEKVAIDLSKFEAELGYEFANKNLLIQALTHKSFFYENSTTSPGHNERLELLGDSVISLVLTELLMAKFIGDSEGTLSQKRAQLVNEQHLSLLANQLKVGEYLFLGRGEIASKGTHKPRLLASALEALIGAVFTEKGYEAARAILSKHFSGFLEEIVTGVGNDQLFTVDYKSKFQEIVQERLQCTPIYESLKEEGPPHDKTFTVAVKVLGEEHARGVGKSKKLAEREAAKKALSLWEEKNAIDHKTEQRSD